MVILFVQQPALKNIPVSDATSLHFEPQVAVLCDQKNGQMYYNQYMSQSGRWTVDVDSRSGGAASSSCSNEKLDILEYCKKVIDNSLTELSV